jgi:type IV pilus assembly protein PilA
MSVKHTNFLTMTSLNSKLQLAVLNRKKGRNLLEKGFTLVELMIVIVIVGVLSSVALPSFLNQRAKAEAAEAVQKISVILRDAVAEKDDGQSTTQIETNLDALVYDVANSNPVTRGDEKFTYRVYGNTTSNDICVVATGKAAGSGGSAGVAGKVVVGKLVDANDNRSPEVKSTLLASTTIVSGATC